MAIEFCTLGTRFLEIGPYKCYELLTGKLLYPVYGYTGYDDGVGDGPHW